MHDLDYSLIDLESMSQLKGKEDNIMVALYQKGIKGRSSLIYQVFGSDHCEMMIIADKPNSIHFSIVSQVDSKEYLGTKDSNCHVSWVILELPPKGDYMLLKIENDSKEDINFVIVAK